MTKLLPLMVLTVALACFAGCGDDLGGLSDEAGKGDGGVGQGGAQDFGLFKQILEEGEIPGPTSLDAVGFLNEHKFELPSANCSHDICLHGLFGVMGNMITGSNCTVVMIGLNTAIDPRTYPRPPLNLTIALDTSGSMAGSPMDFVRQGLSQMTAALQAEDRVSLVGFADGARILVENVAGDNPELLFAIQGLTASGATNIYDGLRTAYDVTATHSDPTRQNRVILLSDGTATAGITNDQRIHDMSAGFSSSGIGLSTIGVGNEFDVELMRGLAYDGAGTFYFLQDAADVTEVFTEEVDGFLVPLGEDARIDLDVGGGYELRNIYGTRSFSVETNAGHIRIPSLHLAERTSVDDNDKGRRGGGGAIVAELLPRQTLAPGADPGHVGTITLDYRLPGTEERVDQTVKILSPLDPGETPDEGFFLGDSVEKSFVALNILVGFQMSSMRADAFDDAGALGVLLGLRDSVDGWLTQTPDADIEDDLRYLDLFIANLRARGAEDPPDTRPRPEPWPQD